MFLVTPDPPSQPLDLNTIQITVILILPLYHFFPFCLFVFSFINFCRLANLLHYFQWAAAHPHPGAK